MTDTAIPQSLSNHSHLNPSDYHTRERFAELVAFVNNAFTGQPLSIDSLPGDASFRRYHRITLEQPLADQDPTYIVMDAPPQLESVERFVSMDLLLATKVNVPTLTAKNISKGFLILQDFGSVEFAHLVKPQQEQTFKGQTFGSNLSEGQTKRINAFYEWAMDSLLQIQTIKTDLAKHSFGVPDYDAELLQKEMSLFTDWFLPYIGIEGFEASQTDIDDESGLSSQQIWQQFTQFVVDNVLTQPQVLVHRDYHSRNLMQDQYHPESLGIIDFQDAVIGAYSYDLVSLVRDAYVDWNEPQVQRWITYFWTQLKEQNKVVSPLIQGQSLGDFITDMNVMGIQRHLKVLGIFVRLAKRDGKQRYLEDIPKVWRDLMLEMTWLKDNGSADIIAAITPCYDWLTRKVAPRAAMTFDI